MASIVVHLMLAFVLLAHAAGQVDVKLADNHLKDTLECTVSLIQNKEYKLTNIQVAKNITGTLDMLITAVPNDTQNTSIFTQGASEDASFQYCINRTTRQTTYTVNVGVSFDCLVKANYVCVVEYTWNTVPNYTTQILVPECREPFFQTFKLSNLEAVLICVSVVFGCVSLVFPAIAMWRKLTKTGIHSRFQNVRERFFPQVEVTTEHEMERTRHNALTERSAENPSLFVIDIQQEQRCAPVPPARDIQGEQHYYSPVSDNQDYHNYVQVLGNEDYHPYLPLFDSQDYHHYDPVSDNQDYHQYAPGLDSQDYHYYSPVSDTQDYHNYAPILDNQYEQDDSKPAVDCQHKKDYSKVAMEVQQIQTSPPMSLGKKLKKNQIPKFPPPPPLPHHPPPLPQHPPPLPQHPPPLPHHPPPLPHHPPTKTISSGIILKQSTLTPIDTSSTSISVASPTNTVKLNTAVSPINTTNPNITANLAIATSLTVSQTTITSKANI